jgi:dTDP-D-glucose 4,6-dehydratase
MPLPDISLARDKLGWQPKVPLEQGLAKTIAYFDGLRAATFRSAASGAEIGASCGRA